MLLLLEACWFVLAVRTAMAVDSVPVLGMRLAHQMLRVEALAVVAEVADVDLVVDGKLAMSDPVRQHMHAGPCNGTAAARSLPIAKALARCFGDGLAGP